MICNFIVYFIHLILDKKSDSTIKNETSVI